MPAYPGAIASFSTKQDFTVVVLAAHVNVLQAEVVAIETFLGAGVSNPVPSTPVTVNDRLAALEAEHAAEAATIAGLYTALPGEVKIYTGAAAPSGYLMCDGGTYPQAEYPALYSVIGQSYGGSGSNFRVPDFRNYFIRGAGGSGGSNLGAVSSGDTHNHGGATDGHGLSQAELPPHSHTYGLLSHTHDMNGHAHTYSVPDHAHNITVGATSGNTPGAHFDSSNGAGAGGGHIADIGTRSVGADGVTLSGQTSSPDVSAIPGYNPNRTQTPNEGPTAETDGGPGLDGYAHSHPIETNGALKPPNVTANFIIKT